MSYSRTVKLVIWNPSVENETGIRSQRLELLGHPELSLKTSLIVLMDV